MLLNHGAELQGFVDRGQFWRSGQGPEGQEPRGALEDCVTPRRDYAFADMTRPFSEAGSLRGVWWRALGRFPDIVAYVNLCESPDAYR